MASAAKVARSLCGDPMTSFVLIFGQVSTLPKLKYLLVPSESAGRLSMSLMSKSADVEPPKRIAADGRADGRASGTGSEKFSEIVNLIQQSPGGAALTSEPSPPHARPPPSKLADHLLDMLQLFWILDSNSGASF